MNINSRITMAIRNFFKKYGRLIFIIFIIWLGLFIINQNLKNSPTITEGTKSYDPDKSIMDDNGDVPRRYRETIKETIDNFYNYCMNQKYEEAYNLLTDDCKEYVYDNDVKRFSSYASKVYRANKVYYIQNYSNLDNNIYIYDYYIMDDIETTGGTGGYGEYKEKLALIKDGNDFKISNQGYIRKEEFKSLRTEDENMKIVVNSKDISYQKEGYNITITNKTDKYILISDGSYVDAVTLNLGDQKRNATNISNATFILEPNTTKQLTFLFDKFADDENEPTEINFNVVCVYDSYNTKLSSEKKEEGKNDFEKLYSFNVPLK